MRSRLRGPLSCWALIELSYVALDELSYVALDELSYMAFNKLSYWALIELSYVALLNFELRDSLISDLPGAFSSSFPWESVRIFTAGLWRIGIDCVTSQGVQASL